MYGKQVSISSFNTYIEIAAPLNELIFDAVYGSWILSLPLLTLAITIKFVYTVYFIPLNYVDSK